MSVGAIGVSGTPSESGGEHDAKCAQQGVAKATGG